MPAPNFELITELQTLTRRDFPVADPTLLQPLASGALIDGEWLTLDANYKLVRGTGEGASLLVFPLHTERGRYDTQSIGKANVLYLGQYEAETKVIKSGWSPSVGDLVTVQDVTYAGGTRRGIGPKTGANVAVVGVVSRFVASSNKVRFIHASNFIVA